MARGVWLATAFAAVGIAACGTSVPSPTPVPDNGVSKKTGAEIFQAAAAAMHTATSVHISGTVASGGKNINVDLSIEAGKQMTGTFSVNGFGSFQLSTPDGATYYMTPDAQFWSNYSAAAAQRFSGKCLSVGPADTSTSFHEMTSSMSKFLTFSDILTQGSGGGPTKGTATSVHGMPAIELKDPSGGSTADVATTGPPFLLELSGGTGQGALYFDQWNKPVIVTAPNGCIDATQVAP